MQLPRGVSDDVTTIKRVDADMTAERGASPTEHVRPRRE